MTQPIKGAPAAATPETIEGASGVVSGVVPAEDELSPPEPPEPPHPASTRLSIRHPIQNNESNDFLGIILFSLTC